MITNTKTYVHWLKSNLGNDYYNSCLFLEDNYRCKTTKVYYLGSPLGSPPMKNTYNYLIGLLKGHFLYKEI